MTFLKGISYFNLSPFNSTLFIVEDDHTFDGWKYTGPDPNFYKKFKDLKSEKAKSMRISCLMKHIRHWAELNGMTGTEAIAEAGHR